MKTKNLTVFGVYLGLMVVRSSRVFICVHVLHFCDADAPAREICPEKPYYLYARVLERDDARYKKLIRRLYLLNKGSHVELHIKDIEGGTIASADDIIIKQEPEKVKISMLAEELDDKF